MSNNAAVTKEGGEIGRAQALQARAACVEPSVHMNPMLLKPQSEIGAQIVVQGKVYGKATAREMQDLKPKLMPFVLESFGKLKQESRHRSGGRRRQRVGDQSPQERHRQYGLCPRGRRAGGRGRRHRPRRGDREAWSAPRRCSIPKTRSWSKASSSIACAATFRCSPRAWRRSRAHGLGVAWARAVLRGRATASGGGCLRSHGETAPARHMAASRWWSASASYRQFRRSRSARVRAGVDLIMVERGRPLPDLRSRGVAGIESDHRGSCDPARRRLGHRSRRACAARRPCARALRRISDARQEHRRPGRHRGQAGAVPGSVCWMSRRRSPEKRRWKRSSGTVQDAVPVRGYEMHMGRTDPAQRRR